MVDDTPIAVTSTPLAGEAQPDGTLEATIYTQTYNTGTNVQLKAIPDPGYYFVRWKDTITDEAEALQDTVTIPLTCDKQITAVFAPITYKLTVAVLPPAGGQVTLEPTQPVKGYVTGTIVTVTASPNQGFDFNDWTGDITGKGTIILITMEKDENIAANFTQKPVVAANTFPWKRVLTYVGIAIVIGLALFLLIRWIMIRRRIPKVSEPCPLFLLSQPSFYQQIDTDTR